LKKSCKIGLKPGPSEFLSFRVLSFKENHLTLAFRFYKMGYCKASGAEVTAMLEKTTRINLLYDFYGPLLTEKQRAMLELYFHEDWSLGEIAGHYGISRQAVYEAVKRAQDAMIDLESRLHLLEKHRRRREIAEEILRRLEDVPEGKRVAEPLLQRLLDLD
jgi:uncharacterized protein